MKFELALVALASCITAKLDTGFPQQSDDPDYFSGLFMLNYDCTETQLNDLVEPKEEQLTGPKVILNETNNEIIKASDYDWENTKTLGWDFPKEKFQLEFYTNTTKYATVMVTEDGWPFDFICGLKRIWLNKFSPESKIKIKPKILKELNGRIFQTNESYIKIVEI